MTYWHTLRDKCIKARHTHVLVWRRCSHLRSRVSPELHSGASTDNWITFQSERSTHTHAHRGTLTLCGEVKGQNVSVRLLKLCRSPLVIQHNNTKPLNVHFNHFKSCKTDLYLWNIFFYNCCSTSCLSVKSRISCQNKSHQAATTNKILTEEQEPASVTLWSISLWKEY